MKENNKGYTIVELIVSFSLIMIVMIYLLRTIVVISEKNNELLVSEEYIVFENTLLEKVQEDIGKLTTLTINNDTSNNKITFNEVNKELQIDTENNSIIYDDIIYELPNSVTFKNNPYDVVNIEEGKYTVVSINIKLDNKDKKVKIIHSPYIETENPNPICKRAKTLHTETCNQEDATYYCSGAGYTASGSKHTTTIAYGSFGEGEELRSGDAFDCDVNNDGIYDEETERFYYVTSHGENAVLIYYNNVTNGVADNTSSSLIAYDLSNENNHGPRTGYANLPTKEQWSNEKIIDPKVRDITNESGGDTTGNGSKDIKPFIYTNKAARLLTVQEINEACNITIGTPTTGELDGCNYLLENTKYSDDNMGTYGYWLETPRFSTVESVWYVHGNRNVNSYNVVNASRSGVRPVIEVLKSDIDISPILEVNDNIPESITKGDSYNLIKSSTSGTSIECRSDKDGVITSTSNLITLGNHTITCTSTTMSGKVSKDNITLNVTYIPYTITNLVVNGSFENNSTSWLLDSAIIASPGFDGNYGLTLASKDPYNMSSQILSTNPIINHKYYASAEYFVNIPATYQVRYEMYYSDIQGTGLLLFSGDNNTNFGNTNLVLSGNKWERKSSIRYLTSSQYTDSSYTWVIRHFTISSDYNLHTDSLIIIDLTDAFGAGNEPDKEWCDKHINYFGGTTTIYK